jgi:hypothetical protein
MLLLIANEEDCEYAHTYAHSYMQPWLADVGTSSLKGGNS